MQYDRTRGDHYIMTCEGLARPVVFPMKRDLKEDIVLSVGRTIGVTRKQIERFLETGDPAVLTTVVAPKE